MQNETPRGERYGRTGFVVRANPGSLLGALLQGIVVQHFEGAMCEWQPSSESPIPHAAVVTNNETGRALWVFASPAAAINLPPNCSAIHLASSRGDMARALNSLDGGEIFVAPELVAHELGQLTAREREIALLVAEGLGNAEVADRLGVSQHTVRSHLRSISSRLGVSSRARLAARVREMQL